MHLLVKILKLLTHRLLFQTSNHKCKVRQVSYAMKASPLVLPIKKSKNLRKLWSHWATSSNVKTIYYFQQAYLLNYYWFCSRFNEKVFLNVVIRLNQIADSLKSVKKLFLKSVFRRFFSDNSCFRILGSDFTHKRVGWHFCICLFNTDTGGSQVTHVIKNFLSKKEIWISCNKQGRH